MRTLPGDLRTRPLERADEPALTELAQVCDETYLEWAPRGWQVPIAPRGWANRYLEPDAWGLLAFAGEQLVATVTFRRHETRLAHVGLLFVHPSRWREGIAGAMLDRAEAEMRARGYARERLWTPLGAPAERFYIARGWERDGRREWHPWMGLEVVGYARDLA